MEIALRCCAGGGADDGPAVYDRANANAPLRLVVWLYRFEDRVIAVDPFAPGLRARLAPTFPCPSLSVPTCPEGGGVARDGLWSYCFFLDIYCVL